MHLWKSHPKDYTTIPLTSNLTAAKTEHQNFVIWHFIYTQFYNTVSKKCLAITQGYLQIPRLKSEHVIYEKATVNFSEETW